MERASDQKHLGLDKKIKFKMHIETVLCKVNKEIPIIKKLRQRLSRKSLLTTYNYLQSVLRPHIGYGDIIYDQPSNESFREKLESVQYKVALTIIGAIKGTSGEKKVMEFGLELLKWRRWMLHVQSNEKSNTRILG